jgi:hypothetical protein
MTKKRIIKKLITRKYKTIEVSPEVFKKGEQIECSSRHFAVYDNILYYYDDGDVDEYELPLTEYSNVDRDYNEQGKLTKETSYDSDGNVVAERQLEYDENELLIYEENDDEEYCIIHRYFYGKDGKVSSELVYTVWKASDTESYSYIEYKHCKNKLHRKEYKCSAESIEAFFDGEYTKSMNNIEESISDRDIIKDGKLTAFSKYYESGNLKMIVKRVSTYPDHDLCFIERIDKDENNEWVLTEEEFIYWE